MNQKEADCIGIKEDMDKENKLLTAKEFYKCSICLQYHVFGNSCPNIKIKK
jgi:hypothetical protein